MVQHHLQKTEGKSGRRRWSKYGGGPGEIPHREELPWLQSFSRLLWRLLPAQGASEMQLRRLLAETRGPALMGAKGVESVDARAAVTPPLSAAMQW